MPATSLPVPRTFRDTRDWFATVMLWGPDFKKMPVSYTVTPEMMFDALLQAIENLSRRTKKAEAQALFSECIEQMRKTQELYRAGQVREGKRQIQIAEETFAQAGAMARGAKQSDLWLDKT